MKEKNETILNKVINLIAIGEGPNLFWPEAMLWLIHVLNISLTCAMKHMTPQEAWSRKKPLVDHFRVFGCITYAHIPNERRQKLDDKSENFVFLGVSESCKAYKLYNPMTKRLVISRDVVFNEESKWNWIDGNSIPNPFLDDDDVLDGDKEEVPEI